MFTPFQRADVGVGHYLSVSRTCSGRPRVLFFYGFMSVCVIRSFCFRVFIRWATVVAFLVFLENSSFGRDSSHRLFCPRRVFERVCANSFVETLLTFDSYDIVGGENPP